MHVLFQVMMVELLAFLAAVTLLTLLLTPLNNAEQVVTLIHRNVVKTANLRQTYVFQYYLESQVVAL